MNRVTYDDKGRLDEVVTDGVAHLECMGGNRWFLSMGRADGSEFCLWFTAKITMTEEREPPKRRAILEAERGSRDADTP